MPGAGSALASRSRSGVHVRSSGKPEDRDISSRRGTLLSLLAVTGASTGSSTGRAGAEDVLAADVESRPEARPLKIRTERAVAIRGDKDMVVANGVLWDEQTVVSSYITFKDMLRKNTRLTAEVGGQRSLGALSLLGFDPTLDIVVFRSEIAAGQESLGPALKVVTGNYVVGQSVLGLVRDGEGAFVTTGIVSGTDRVIIMANGQKNRGLLQTDCPISLSSAGAGALDPDRREAVGHIHAGEYSVCQLPERQRGQLCPAGQGAHGTGPGDYAGRVIFGV